MVMLSRCLGEEEVGDEIQTEIRKFENRVASEKQTFLLHVNALMFSTWMQFQKPIMDI